MRGSLQVGQLIVAAGGVGGSLTVRRVSCPMPKSFRRSGNLILASQGDLLGGSPDSQGER